MFEKLCQTVQPRSVNRRINIFILFSIIVWGGMVLFSCAPKHIEIVPQVSLVRVLKSEYPLFQDRDDYNLLSNAIDMSLVYLHRLSSQQEFVFGSDSYSVGHIIKSLESFQTVIQQHPSVEALNSIIRQEFIVYQAIGRTDERDVLFTGYYEPVLQGSLEPTAEFTIPIYGRPSDLVEIDLTPFAEDLQGRRIIGRYTGRTVVPYPQSKDIRGQNGFSHLAKPIAWVGDEFTLFNLQVQGSGKVVLEDGTLIHVHYDVSNGRPYRSIGRLLIEEGWIPREEMSMQTIRSYFSDHPDEVRDILNYNPRYIFFRRIDQGPLGALGVPITARRSIAVDRALFPLAALAYVELDLPLVGNGHAVDGWKEFKGFALAQDTGSAITGSGRVDFFWGSGLPAEIAAGHLNNPGRLYFLVLATGKSSG